MRVGILGGSFNPPTIGHQLMAVEVLNLNLVDEVWMVPCGYREDKKYPVSDEQRLEMTKLLIEDIDSNQFKIKIKVDSIEIKQGKMIPTYCLLQYYQQNHPNFQFHFILGADLIKDLEKWDYGVQLKSDCHFIVFERPLSKINKEMLPRHSILVKALFTASSSTEIRN